MRLTGGAGATGGVRRRFIGVGATVLIIGAAAMTPAVAGASASATPKDCGLGGLPSKHFSNISEFRSSCSVAHKVAKHAEKNKNDYQWSYRGFHCHGDSTEGSPPLAYTCKKGRARVYFTYTYGSGPIVIY